MAHQGHLYRLSLRGRSIESVPGVGGTTFTARLQCSRCPKQGERRCREMMPPEQIDRKFKQAGWTIDPHVCPDCRASAAKEKTTMASTAKPSRAAIQAQGRMFTLLQQHFDPDAGAYAAGWDDAKIANDTGIAPDLVTEYRRECFGELKEPEEVRKLRDDITSLDNLLKETFSTATGEIAALRARLAVIGKRWVA